ncbi:hypothetical protein FAM22277_00120 [Lacticaseibacillus paracasei]|jgi:hypothetical protein|uniref:hypothetical protein n=1 Tax=Lacticaseibacillus paracasei TaxID=1597 RepID=UPI000F0BA57B|nr:hypothetical protein [Lacticaseibacillus paracasei]RNE04887.1 hypothetical protein FAM22277_00120 [Lacticaseibacillus paracasei]
MDQKQILIGKMLKLQHIFEKQPDETSKMVVLKIKQAINRLANKRIQGVNIEPEIRPVSTFIRDEMREHDYSLTLEQRTALFDVEETAQTIAKKFFIGFPGVNGSL